MTLLTPNWLVAQFRQPGSDLDSPYLLQYDTLAVVIANQNTESERRTRRERIDPRLRAAGWDIIPFDEKQPLSAYVNHAIEEYPTANGPADYALVVDGQILGVVEAKRVTLGPQNVLTQGEKYR